VPSKAAQVEQVSRQITDAVHGVLLMARATQLRSSVERVADAVYACMDRDSPSIDAESARSIQGRPRDARSR
jgi:hypothetical protein